MVDPAARLDYDGPPLDDAFVASLSGTAPLALLRSWYREMDADERVVEPGAMVLATADADGVPDARTVLAKGLDVRGFRFFTALGSVKASQLASRPLAAVVLGWHAAFRQVRARGVVERVGDDEAAAYFASRPRESQLGAWASQQSEPVASRDELQRAVDAADARFAGDVPLPPHWGGFVVRPWAVELWVGRQSRLHDRVLFTARSGRAEPLDAAGAWDVVRLQP